MEIYRRMGIADQLRAAGLPAHCPMDIFVVLSLVEPPLVHHVHPSVAEAKARIASREDGSRAARALSAHLAVHARAAAEIDRGGAAQRHRALRLRVRVLRAGSRARSPRRSGPAPAPRRSAPPTWWLRRRRQPGAPAARHRAQRRGQHPAAAAGAVLLRGPVRAHPDRQGAALSRRRRRRRRFLIVQDSTRHFTLHSVVEKRRRHGDDVRARRRHAGQIRHALCRAVEA